MFLPVALFPGLGMDLVEVFVDVRKNSNLPSSELIFILITYQLFLSLVQGGSTLQCSQFNLVYDITIIACS